MPVLLLPAVNAVAQIHKTPMAGKWFPAQREAAARLAKGDILIASADFTNLGRRAGAGAQAYRDPKARLYVYDAQVFGDAPAAQTATNAEQ